MNAFTFASPSKRIALLIDADNVPCDRLAAIVEALAAHGRADIRRAYGDWASDILKPWKPKLHALAIRPIQQFSYTSGKNATDIALVIDAVELLHTQKPDAFCIVSSDADFTPLVMHLRERGCEVYGFGERKAPPPFRDACTFFAYIDGIASCAAKGGEAEAICPTAAEVVTATAKSTPSPSAPASKKPSGRDNELILRLRGVVRAAAGDDG